MPVETRSREGRYVAIHRRHAGGVGSNLLRVLPAIIGVVLLAAPAFLARPVSGLSLAGLIALELLLAVGGYKLLAEASRRDRVVTTLHVASGEIEARFGRGLLSLTRAFGAVETDRFQLTRIEGGSGPLFTLALLPRFGPPVPVVGGDLDEVACRDVGLVLSQGMGVPLEDARYPGMVGAPGAGTPARVGRSGGDPRTVLTWEYRDRFRPRASLLALGVIATLSGLLPILARWMGSTLILVALVILAMSVALAGHVLFTLVTRRVTLRPDAVRVERLLSAIPLVQRLAPYEEIKAVLVLRRGPLAALHLRLSGGRPGVVLPFEEPSLAGWLKLMIERAAHQSGERASSLAQGGILGT
jgi:hypothetical protein